MNHASERSGQTPRPSNAAPALRIRYGRLALALAGLAALVAVPVTVVLLVAGAAPWWAPVSAAGLLAADVAALRLLAIRDRRRRVQRAFRDAMAAQPAAAPAAAPEPAPMPAPEPEEPFDAELHEEPPAPNLSAEELRAAALAEAVRSGALAPRPAETPWQPVELPRPTYVDAPRAERPEPAPLDLPEEPRPAARTSLRAPAAAGAAETASADLPGSGNRQEPSPMTGILNLDDVLQRRRA